MLCTLNYQYDRRAMRVVYAFLAEALRLDIPVIRRLQNTDITIRWLELFLNHLPEKAQSLKESQQVLEQIAQTKDDKILLNVAAAMSTIITTLSQDNEEVGKVEALANAIVNGVDFLTIYQNALMPHLIAEENPVCKIISLRKSIERLNLMSKGENFTTSTSIKMKFNSSKRYGYGSDSSDEEEFSYQLIMRFRRTAINYIRKLTEVFYGRVVTGKVIDSVCQSEFQKIPASYQIWHCLLKKYCFFILELYEGSIRSDQKGTFKVEEQIVRCLTEKLKSLCVLLSNTDMMYDKIVELKKQRVEHQEGNIKAKNITIECQREIIIIYGEQVAFIKEQKGSLCSPNNSVQKADQKNPLEKDAVVEKSTLPKEEFISLDKMEKKLENEEKCYSKPPIMDNSFLKNELFLLQSTLCKIKNEPDREVEERFEILEKLEETIMRNCAIIKLKDEEIRKCDFIKEKLYQLKQQIAKLPKAKLTQGKQQEATETPKVSSLAVIEEPKQAVQVSSNPAALFGAGEKREAPDNDYAEDRVLKKSNAAYN